MAGSVLSFAFLTKDRYFHLESLVEVNSFLGEIVNLRKMDWDL